MAVNPARWAANISVRSQFLPGQLFIIHIYLLKKQFTDVVQKNCSHIFSGNDLILRGNLI